MSHFTVLVHLTEEEVKNGLDNALEAKMQPYHEYECTGIKDQYVIKVDETDEVMDSYNADTVDSVYDENGSLIGSKYSDACKRFRVKQDSFSSELILPSGYEIRETPLNVLYTFEEYLTDWCGNSFDGKYSSFENGRFYRFTNPNSKWDWWSIGGRWSGRFLDVNGEHKDIIQKKDWNLTKELSDVVLKFAPIFDRFEENADKFAGIEFVSWDDCCKKFVTEEGNTDYNLARNFYHNQEYKNILKSVFSLDSDEEYAWLLHDPETFYNVAREDFMKSRILNRIGTFAVLDDAGWHEKGSMGWFACVSDEKSDWNEIFLDKLHSIPDNDYLVLVDCHI